MSLPVSSLPSEVIWNGRREPRKEQPGSQSRVQRFLQVVPGCFGPVNAESLFYSIPVLSQSRLTHSFFITNLIDLGIETACIDALKLNSQF